MSDFENRDEIYERNDDISSETTENGVQDNSQNNIPDNTQDNTQDSTQDNTQEVPIVDGTYRYSYRKASQENREGNESSENRDWKTPEDDNYRKSPEMREQENSWRNEEHREDRNRYDYWDNSQSSSRHPYGQQRQNNGYDYNTSDQPKKKHTGKIIAVIACALGLGLLVSAACWSIGGLISPESSREGLLSSIDSSDTTETDASQEEEKDPVEPAISSAGTVQGNTSAVSGDGAAIIVTDVSDVVEKALPTIVAITTKTVYENYNNSGYNPFYGYFGGNGGSSTYEVEGAGSGIIIGDDGTELWIVTNCHVVEGSESVTIGFCDGSDVTAYIKGTDSKNDLAVVGIKLEDLSASTKNEIKAIEMGSSDDLRLGESVIAIGNALGIGQSVTTGCVSALNRDITTSENTTLTTIQTDAAINPGNSGGALLNSKGELIGINVAKDADVEVEGMGYAIPISSAKDIIQNLTTMEPKVAVSEEEYPYLGVQLKDISSSLAEAYGMPVGILVYSVEEGTPADQAGILVQDIIVAFNGVEVSSYDELQNELQYYAGGTDVTVTVQRLENGVYVEKELKLTLGLRSDYQAESQQQTSPSRENQEDNDSFNSFPGFDFGR